MLRLNNNIVPTWLINWSNTIFQTSEYIGYITEVVVDWAVVTNFTFSADIITVPVAPVSSILISFFSREERDIEGNWELTMGDLIDWVYNEIWRKQYSKIYPKERIRRELNDTIGIMYDNIPEASRVQQYSFNWLNWLRVINQLNNIITPHTSYTMDIKWMFLAWENVLYTYYGYDWNTFTVMWDLTKVWDYMNVWHRIPYWVSKVSEVYVNSQKLEYVDSRDFYIRSEGVFTIITDKEWNQYLFLPFSSREYTAVIKYVPDYAYTTTDEDILNIEKRYRRIFIYDVTYRLLASREDERWQFYKIELKELERKYRSHKANATRKTKMKVNIWERETQWKVYNILPTNIYAWLR